MRMLLTSCEETSIKVCKKERNDNIDRSLKQSHSPTLIRWRSYHKDSKWFDCELINFYRGSMIYRYVIAVLV